MTSSILLASCDIWKFWTDDPAVSVMLRLTGANPMRREVMTTFWPTDDDGIVIVYVPSTLVLPPTPSPRDGMTTFAPGTPFPFASVTRPVITVWACALDAIADDAMRARPAASSRPT